MQVGSVEMAREVAQLGVDAVIAQGSEAGGHVRGEASTLVLVPAVVDAVAPVPVLAVGGIADGRGVAAALGAIRPAGPFLPLGSVRQKAGKLVHAWAWEGEADPGQVRSNMMRTEWSRGSGRWLTFPEVDRCEWFDAQSAREKINPAQAELIDRLEAALFRDGPSQLKSPG